ncbi:1-acyl-sn-glycerol-3-phosphate acyltransferase [uncultured Roseobacter sp.]|uniref:lysophospholipid acyltransferase family protein n=1 Tax=uncultured Roseobacter sp. TaxID=114847 RepID=UPI002616662C|nr:lysophospholipid acyltransferase family protein [uncultured Roseobacter sp.]
MTPTWYGEAPPPDLPPPGMAGWARIILRGVPLLVLVLGGLLLMLLLRLAERPLCGAKRPVTPHITVFVCRSALRILGIRLRVSGEVRQGQGAVVTNHSSWLDIFVLNAVKRIYFVSKAEVAGWPGIGWLARATGTVFIERNRSQAGRQAELFRSRLSAGHRLLFFPEGTSSDGQHVLPFKTSLFAAFFAEGLRETLSVQPVTLVYHAPTGQDPRFFGWWGDMTFGGHFLTVLAFGAGGQAEIICHPPMAVHSFSDRKSLAAACEKAVRSAHPG